jgi:hypothetical protein
MALSCLRLMFNSQKCLCESPTREATVCTKKLHNCCYECARQYAGNQIDDGLYLFRFESGPHSRSNIKCIQGCDGHYADIELGLFLEPKKVEKLERNRFLLAGFQVHIFPVMYSPNC